MHRHSRYFGLVLTLLILLLVVLSIRTGYAAKKYRMVCQGGGDASLEYYVVTPRPRRKWGHPDSPWIRGIRVRFKKARFSARYAPPPAGYCAYLERRFAQDDPARFSMSWSEKKPSVRRRARPGEYISLLKMARGKIRIASVYGKGMNHMIRGFQHAKLFYHFTVEKKKSSRGGYYFLASKPGKYVIRLVEYRRAMQRGDFEK